MIIYEYTFLHAKTGGSTVLQVPLGCANTRICLWYRIYLYRYSIPALPLGGGSGRIYTCRSRLLTLVDTRECRPAKIYHPRSTVRGIGEKTTFKAIAKKITTMRGIQEKTESFSLIPGRLS